MLYAADFNHIIRCDIVTHILLDISVVNIRTLQRRTNANCLRLHGTIYRAYEGGEGGEGGRDDCYTYSNRYVQ